MLIQRSGVGGVDGVLVRARLFLQLALCCLDDLLLNAVLEHVVEHLLGRSGRVVALVAEHEVLRVLLRGDRVELLLGFLVLLTGKNGDGFVNGLPARQLVVFQILFVVVAELPVKVVIGESGVVRVVVVKRCRLVPGRDESAAFRYIVLSRVGLLRGRPGLEQREDAAVHGLPAVVFALKLVEERIGIPLLAGLLHGAVFVRVGIPVVLDAAETKVRPVHRHVLVQRVDAGVVVVAVEILLCHAQGGEPTRLELLVDFRVRVLAGERGGHEPALLAHLVLGRVIVLPVVLVELLDFRPCVSRDVLPEHVVDAAGVPLVVVTEIFLEVLYGRQAEVPKLIVDAVVLVAVIDAGAHAPFGLRPLVFKVVPIRTGPVVLIPGRNPVVLLVGQGIRLAAIRKRNLRICSPLCVGVGRVILGHGHRAAVFVFVLGICHN